MWVGPTNLARPGMSISNVIGSPGRNPPADSENDVPTEPLGGDTASVPLRVATVWCLSPHADATTSTTAPNTADTSHGHAVRAGRRVVVPGGRVRGTAGSYSPPPTRTSAGQHRPETGRPHGGPPRAKMGG